MDTTNPFLEKRCSTTTKMSSLHTGHTQQAKLLQPTTSVSDASYCHTVAMPLQPYLELLSSVTVARNVPALATSKLVNCSLTNAQLGLGSHSDVHKRKMFAQSHVCQSPSKQFKSSLENSLSSRKSSLSLVNRILSTSSKKTSSAALLTNRLLNDTVSAAPTHTSDIARDTKEDTQKLLKTDTDVLPLYQLKLSDEDSQTNFKEVEMEVMFPDVVTKEEDGITLKKHLDGLKKELINLVSASLMMMPDFTNKSDPTRVKITGLCDKISQTDPEFILKVALYARCELNVRIVPNFLLAWASSRSECRPYLKKYFSATTRLPSDWISVGDLYRQLDIDRKLNLPSALRKVMVNKFPEFDAYQLAKYNKAPSRKKVPPGRQPANQLDLQSGDENEHLPEKAFSLKTLIRMLHVSEPVYHVMCLLGKKYPNTLENFYKSRLPGTWDEAQAGKRMKLPVPETWETQISSRGNIAEVWEELLDHGKLPFIAMVKNLRNMIQARISYKHHDKVIKRLTDVNSVSRSQMYPLSFFSAYIVLEELEEDKKTIATLAFQTKRQVVEVPLKGGKRKILSHRASNRMKAHRGRISYREKQKQKHLAKMKYWSTNFSYSVALLHQYRKALDTAVQIATTYNIEPIKGSALIFCDVGRDMLVPCSASKGLGRAKQVAEMGILLGLMCKQACEKSKLIVYGDESHQQVQLKEGTILDNMKRVMDLAKLLNTDRQNEALSFVFEEAKNFAKFPVSILDKLLLAREKVDTVIVLSNTVNIDDKQTGDTVPTFRSFVDKYRALVNPDLIRVNIDLARSSNKRNQRQHEAHDEKDISIVGFSDKILRYISNQGDDGLLKQVENVDKTYNLTAVVQSPLTKPAIIPVEQKVPRITKAPQWRSIRVFISSTFRDMHGERDLLTRFVFPELRARAKDRLINVYEVDLRWGITESASSQAGNLDLCLSEIKSCQLFVGIIGERYGWIPELYDVTEDPDLDWLKSYPPGASVTELEMHYAALANPDKAQETAFFFIRNNSFIKTVPKKYREDFCAENRRCDELVKKLKSRVRVSGLELYDEYPCYWGGVVDGRPIVAGLDLFGNRVLNNAWNAIMKLCPEEEDMMDEVEYETSMHAAFIESKKETFVGRTALVVDCLDKITKCSQGIIVLSGKAGSGKSSLMATVMSRYCDSSFCKSSLGVIPHFIGATSGSASVQAMLTRLCHEIKQRFVLELAVPSDYKNLLKKFAEFLSEATEYLSSPLVLFIDGLDLLENTQQGRNLHWIPDPLPKNVVLVMSVTTGCDVHHFLQKRGVTDIPLGGLDIWEKAQLIRQTLATHRKVLDESAFNNQMKLLTSKREATHPLFLKLACEELRVFGVFEKISDKLMSLPHTTANLLQDILQRLEQDHGKELLSTVLCLLSCSRCGLQESEVHYLLSYYHLICNVKIKASKISMYEIRKLSMQPNDVLPPAVFSRLLRAVRGFLRPTGCDNILHLAHTDIKSAVKTRYMRGMASETEAFLHRLLAAYYWLEADPCRDDSWTGNNIRAFSEMPYHLACSGSYRELEMVLCNLNFIYAKFKLGLGVHLLEDFLGYGNSASLTAQRDRQKFVENGAVQQYKSFVSIHQHILLKCPILIWQQALNEDETSLVALEAKDKQPCLKQHILEVTNKLQCSEPCLLTLPDYPLPVTCLAASLSKTQFASGGADGIVWINDTETGQEQKMFVGHSKSISSVCFAGPNILCSASLDNTLSLWSITEGHRLHVLKGHKRCVSSCAADPKGKAIVSGSWDCTVKVWDVAKGTQITQFVEKRPINTVTLDPSTQIVASGSWDGSVKLYDIFNQKRIAIIRGSQSSIRSVTFSPNGIYIVAATLDGSVELFSAKNGVKVGNLRGHSMPVNSIMFSANGDKLVTAGDDRKIKVWTGNFGKLVTTYKSDKDSGYASCVSITDQGTYIVIGYHNDTMRIINMKTGDSTTVSTKVGTLRCVRIVHFTRSQLMSITNDEDDASDLVFVGFVGSSSKMVQLLLALQNDQLIITDKEKHKLSCEEHGKPVLSFSFAMFKEHEMILLTASEDFTARLTFYSMFDHMELFCDSSTDSSASDISTHSKTTRNIAKQHVLTGHTGPVSCCALSPDGTIAATGSHDKTVMMWSVTSKDVVEAQRTIYLAHNDWVTCCAWSDNSKYLITGSNDFSIKLWNATTGEEKHCFSGHEAAVNSVAFKSGCIVSGSSDNTVKVWSHKGAEITTLIGHTQRINDCDIAITASQDGGEEEADTEEWQPISDWAKQMDLHDWRENQEQRQKSKEKDVIGDVLVVSASDDSSVKLWRPLEGNELLTLSGHQGPVVSVTITQKDKMLSSSLDHSIRMWNINTEVPAHQHETRIVDVAIQRSNLATASSDGIVALWNFDGHDSAKLVTKIKLCDFVKNCPSREISRICFDRATSGLIIVCERNLYLWKDFSKMVVSELFDHNEYITTILTTARRDIFIGDWNGTLTHFSPSRSKTSQGKRNFKRNFNDFVLCMDVFLDPCSSQTHVAYAVQNQLKVDLVSISKKNELDLINKFSTTTRGWIYSCRLSPWINYVYAGDGQGYLSVYSVLDGSQTPVFNQKIHNDKITCIVLIDQGNLLVTGSNDKKIKLWHTNTYKQLGQYTARAEITAMQAKENMIVAGDMLGRITFLKLHYPKKTSA